MTTNCAPTLQRAPAPAAPAPPMTLDRQSLTAFAAECGARADEIEGLRTLPADLVRLGKAAGVFRLAMPRALGGLELDPVTIVSAIEEVSTADGSAGWTAMIGNSTAFFAWLDPAVAADLLGDDPDIASTSMFAPIGRARRHGSGFVVDGRWPFNSGCPHAEWYQVGVTVIDGDVPATRADGSADLRFAFVRREQAEVIDTWRSLGLKGTGSHDIAISGLRLPERQTASPFTDGPCHDGPLWRLGFWALLSVLVAGVPLGIGRRALDEFAALAPTKRRGISATTIAEDAHVQLDFGRAEARLQAAKALVHETVGRTWDTVLAGDPLSDEASCRLGLASHEAMEAALHAVDVAYRFAGASATYSGQPLERCFRDVHTASQHIVFSGMLPQAYARYRTGQH